MQGSNDVDEGKKLFTKIGFLLPEAGLKYNIDAPKNSMNKITAISYVCRETYSQERWKNY